MLHRLVLAVALVATAACSGTQLEPASASNVVDTFTLGALHGAALSYPSAFDVTIGLPVRTDETSGFDFVYDIDTLGRHVFIPLHALAGLGVASGSNPGFIVESGTFDGLTTAPSDGYLTTDTLVITPGEVLAVRSRVSCYLGVPQYGKLQVIDFDDSTRTMRVATLSDINCGYKNLQLGVPKN